MNRLALITAVLLAAAPAVLAADNPFIGNWALTIPGGGAGWLGVTQEKGYLDAGLLWGGGSVMPVASVFTTEDTLYVTRTHEVKRKDASGKVIRTHIFTEAIMGRLESDGTMSFTTLEGNENGKGMRRDTFTGKRIPPVPAAPDLSKVKFGEPINLFDGKSLDGWKLTDSGAVNGWSVKDGVLDNNPAQKEGQPHINYGNLRTVREFEDFNLKLEFNVPKNGNSGVYLRGIYEIQVADTYGKPLDSHNMGGLYSRITPSVAAEKPAGEWQSYDITLVDRHLTVVLNGKKIIDNQPVLGCTGGALWSDEFRPGPLYLQGDHAGVQYRNIVIRPVVK